MRAVILCAGEGTRLRPITFQKPKPLLVVGGKTLLENTVHHLHQSGIRDITLVVGYMAEKFTPFAGKYGLRLVHSQEYDTKNSHSSLLLVKDMLEDAVIVDGDLFLHNNVFQAIQPGKSQFLTQKTEYISGWQCIVDDEARIVSVKKDLLSGYSLSGVSYWTGEGARLLAAQLEHCAPHEYWEDAALRILDKTPVYMTACAKFQTEINVLYHAYFGKLLSAEEIAMQCSDNGYMERLKGLTNFTYRINFRGEPWVLRIPGIGTDKLIDRKFEQEILARVGTELSPQSQCFEGGIKIMPFLQGYKILSKQDVMTHVPQLCHVLRKLHMLPVPDIEKAHIFCVENEIAKYEGIAKTSFLTAEERARIVSFARRLDADEKVLCHRDLLLENILVNDDSLQLIDFEYANYTSRYWDIASFITEARITLEQQRLFVEHYGGLDFQRVMEATIVVEYIWSLWGFAMGYMDYGRKRMCALDTTLELYETMF